MNKLSYNDAQIESLALVKKIRELVNFPIAISHPHYASDKYVFYFMVEIPYTPHLEKHKDGSYH
jgi:hypothetical protein